MQGQLHQALPLEAEASATAMFAAGILPDLPAEPQDIQPSQKSENDPALSPSGDASAQDSVAIQGPNEAPAQTEQLPEPGPSNDAGASPTNTATAADDGAEEVKEAYRVANIFEHMVDLIGSKLSKRISNDSTEKLYGKHPEKGWNWALGYEKSPQSAVTLNKANRTIAIIFLALIGFTIYGIIWAYLVKPQIENAHAEGTNSIYIPGSYAVPNGSAQMPITGQYAPTALPGTSQFGPPMPQQSLGQPITQPLTQPVSQPLAQPVSQPLGAHYGNGSPYGQPTQMQNGHYQASSRITNTGHYGTPTQGYLQNPTAYPSNSQTLYPTITQPVYPHTHQPYSQNNLMYPSANTAYPNNSNYAQYMPAPPVYQSAPDHSYGQAHSVYSQGQSYAPPAIPAYPSHYATPRPNEDRNRVKVITGR